MNTKTTTDKLTLENTVCATRRTGRNFGHVGEVRALTKRGPGRLLAETELSYPHAQAAMTAAKALRYRMCS